MRLSVDRVRWVLIAGAGLLVLSLAGFVGYGRWKALKTFHDLVKRSGAKITRETSGFTYSQTLKGRTIFTIHAARAQQRADGKWVLHDAELTLFGKSGERTDHIYGAEFEYDPDAGVAKAMGQVHMDLEAPQGLNAGAGRPQKIRGKEGRAPSAPRADESMSTIHVVTSGLVYLRKLGVAATQEDVEFRFAGMEAHAHGAEFDEADSVAHLLADVRLDGDLRGKAIHLTATRADLDRGHQLATLSQPVLVSEGKRIRSDAAVIRMRKSGAVESTRATGNVVLTQGTRTVRGAALELTMNENADPRLAVMTGGVSLEDKDAQRPMQASAQRAELAFNEEGQARLLTATGNARMMAKDAGLARSMAGERLEVALSADRAASKQMHVSSVHAVGSASAAAESLAVKTGVRRNSVLRADDLQASFAEGEKVVTKQVVGNGHARLEQMASNGEVQNSSADSVTMLFDGKGQMVSAVETGHVTLRAQSAAKKGSAAKVSTGSAERAVYDAVSETLRLSGKASVAQSETQMTARDILLHGLGDADAEGDVLATLAAEKSSRESSHVMSERASMSRGGEFAVFTGTDAKPARLWQGGSQLQAAVLTMDGKLHTLMARPAKAGGRVLAIFANAGGAAAGTSKASKSQTTRVLSTALDYSDARGEAVFTGGVQMLASGGNVRSDRATVFLSQRAKDSKSGDAKSGNALANADPAGRALDHAVLTGSVRLTQPGRVGTADQMLYTAATETFVLTGSAGNRPRVSDTQQGSVVGTTLLFSTADSTIVVAGEGKGHNRVRTEVGVDPGAAEGQQQPRK